MMYWNVLDYYTAIDQYFRYGDRLEEMQQKKKN